MVSIVLSTDCMEGESMKMAIIANVIIKSVYAVCVTILAIEFKSIGILWWFILLLFIGLSYKES